MPRKAVQPEVIRVHRRHDGRYVSRNEILTDSPLGVDDSLSLALGTARREATIVSVANKCRVRIEVMDAGGKWREIDAVDPPRA